MMTRNNITIRCAGFDVEGLCASGPPQKRCNVVLCARATASLFGCAFVLYRRDRSFARTPQHTTPLTRCVDSPSDELYVTSPTPNCPPPHRTPPHNPNIASLDLEPPVRAFDKHRPDVSQRAHEDGFVLVRPVHHADATCCVVQSLQTRWELREEGGRVVLREKRLVRCEVLQFAGG
jgi:hypothetical protein